MTFDAMKAQVLENLRALLGGKEHSPFDYPMKVDDLRAGVDTTSSPFAPAANADFYSVIFALVVDGIIVPGSQLGPDHGNTHRYFPYFLVTSYGRKVLDPAQNPVTPHDAESYIAETRRRIPNADDIIITYLVEAIHSFQGRRCLATTVMLGVAGEALMEWLYDAFIAHVPSGAASKLAKDFAQTKLHTERRFNTFRRALDVHRPEFDADMWCRVSAHLDSLNSVIKVNRDDVAHRRAFRADAQLALGNLTSFPTLLSVANELAVALRGNACSARNGAAAPTT
jgi:hypothetical protein